MTFSKLNFSVIGTEEIAVRFYPDDLQNLFFTLDELGCAWNSGKPLLELKHRYEADSDGCYTISVSEDRRVMYGTTTYYLGEGIVIFDYLGCQTEFTNVDDLL